jgi:nonsense-mediated mRNA decay protein 3
LSKLLSKQVKTSKKLIGTDDKSNISNYKYTNLVEICPLCKDDLLYLPPRMARNLGNINRLVLVKNITQNIHLIDPLSGQTAQMSPEAFWREPIRPVITAARSRFVRYVILGKDAVIVKQNQSKKAATRRNRCKLALVTAAKEDDLGKNDSQVQEHSHVGYLMKAGDVGVGYDLTDVQFVDDDAEDARAAGKLPDVVMLRKLYGGVATQDSDAAKQRVFKLQRLEADAVEADKARKAKRDKENDDMDEEDFLREVEADKEMRINMNLYKTEVAMKKLEDGQNGNEDDEDDEDDQQVQLDELLDGLVLDDDNDKEMKDAEFNEDLPWGGLGGQAIEEGEKAAKDGISYLGREGSQTVKDKDAAMPVDSFAQQFVGKDFKFI